ncbi:MAG: response regulator [Planctomycetota bacterium]
MSSLPIRVLVAEDNPGLAKVLGFKLKSSGMQPTVCYDGQDAWERFQSGDFEAVVSDQEMPRMTGVELFRKVRSINELVPIFLVTGRQLELTESKVVDELSIHRIFAKPFSPNLIVDVLTETANAYRTKCAANPLSTGVIGVSESIESSPQSVSG